MNDVPTPSPVILAAQDPRRMGKLRHAMHLLIPKVVTRAGVDVLRHDKVSVMETKNGVRLSLDVDDDGISVKSVDLSLPECCDLADMLNRIRARVAKRPSYRT